jgi:hypothetical protein
MPIEARFGDQYPYFLVSHGFVVFRILKSPQKR